jgi:hypothetical protein
MRSAIICAVGLTVLGSFDASAADKPNALRRVSCTVVRYYVAKYSEGAAESWARSQGATEAEIATAKKCLGGSAGVVTASFAPK